MDPHSLTQRWPRATPGRLVTGAGAALLAVALGQHIQEMSALDESLGPLLAVLLDGGLALCLAYAGHWLTQSGLGHRAQWHVAGWSLGGSVLVGATFASTLAVRVFEGRTLSEPFFPLLVALAAGGLAGLVAGYYNAKSRARARREKTIGNAFAFVNDLLRHDLRNDLNVIRGYASVIEDRVDSSPETDGGEKATIIASKADEALTRIETTGAIADTITGDPVLHEVDLVALTRKVAERVEATYDLPVTCDCPERAPVRANAGLRPIVDNLLENAAEHNDAENPHIDIEISLLPDTVRLRVADNGPGLPPEQKARFVEAGTDHPDGGGLGLTKRLVEAYGGAIEARDNEPRGAVFVVDIPRADTDEGTGTASAAQVR